MNARRWLFIVVVRLACGQAAGGAEGIVKLSATVGFSGRGFAGRWCPAQVKIVNTREQLDADVLVEVLRGRGTVAYRKAMLLGKGYRGSVEMCFWCDDDARVRSVRLVRRGTQRNLHDPVRPRLNVGRSARVAAVVGAPVRLRGVLRDWTVVEVKAQDLPRSSLGYDAIDVLIAGDALNDLDTWQCEALRRWIVQGGEFYGVGVVRYWNPAGLLAQLLPVAQIRPMVLTEPKLLWRDGTPLEGLSGTRLVAARMTPSPGAQVELRGQSIEQAGPGDPLIVRRPMGLGWVGFIGFDPGDRLLAGADPIWPKLLSAARRRVLGVRLEESPQQRIEHYLRSVPGAPMSRLWVVGFMMLFAAAIGPMDYWLLRKLGRFHLGVLTFAVIVGAFTLFAYAASYAGRARRLTFRALSVLDVSPGANVMAGTTYCAAFSPFAANYELSANLPEARLALMGDTGERRSPTIHVDEDSPRVHLPMRIWTGKQMCCRWVIEEYGPPGGTPAERVAGAIGRLGLMHHCWLVSGRGVCRLRHLDKAIEQAAAGTQIRPDRLPQLAQAVETTLRAATPTSLGDWLKNLHSALGRPAPGGADLPRWLSFGPATVRGPGWEKEGLDGLPTELSLRRNVERGRVYLSASVDRCPLELTFSGRKVADRYGALARIDVTDLVDSVRWR